MNTIDVSGKKVPVRQYHTVVVGSGAAALNCAEHLFEFGVTDIAIVTDILGGGASNNSGSDKQTYYKMGNIADQFESPIAHAKTLTAAGCTHGDIAYTEAANSLREFYHLVQNGVPFPHNSFGAYVGYKTDHDPLQRATSAGPKTSKFMVERSLRQVRRNATPIHNRTEVIALLTTGDGAGKRVIGVLAIDKTQQESEGYGLIAFQAHNVVMATGGPGEMYEWSVYPKRQIGNHGILFKAGARAHNLTESQFGLGSVSYRWNLSGTYQQVIPNYFSTKHDGSDRRNFLTEYITDTGHLSSNVFLKGYQWPFDPQRIAGGNSSLIDLLVWHESALKNRRVFMDFSENTVPGPGMKPFDFSDLSSEAYQYLERSDALITDSPFARLQKMNQPSIDHYSEHGIELGKEPLEAAVMSQHCNGGFVMNRWWQSTVAHLFVLGELAGTHGVKRPGGSSLNATQVGGLRAADFIAHGGSEPDISSADFKELAADQVAGEIERIERIIASSESATHTIGEIRREIQHRMSSYAAHIRSVEGVRTALSEARALQRRIDTEGMRIPSRKLLVQAIQNAHLCVTHRAYLEAISALLDMESGSRGSHLVLDPNGETMHEKLGDDLKIKPENEALRNTVLEIWLSEDGEFQREVVDVRPLPEDDSWFENTWADYRSGSLWN